MSVEITAEIGINHNGDVELASRMVQEAARAGVDHVKFQVRNVDLVYSPEELAASCESPWGGRVEDKVRGRELSWDDFEFLDRHCRGCGVTWTASCFDARSFEEIEDLFPLRPYNKVASCMALHEGFLRRVAAAKRRTLVSLGLASEELVSKVAGIFEEAGCEYVLMHTTALYPAPLNRLNLLCIPRLIEQYHAAPFCVGVGYSGHETGVAPSVVAATLGAAWIERHFTLDRSMYGADQSASLEPEGLRRLVRDIRNLEMVGGDGKRTLHGDEKIPVRRYDDDWRVAQ